MKVRTLKKDEPLPPRKTIGGFSSLKKLAGYQEMVKKMRDGAITTAEVMDIEEKDAQAIGKTGAQEDLAKIAGRIADRLKKELVVCYEAGVIENRNFAIYQIGNQVFIKKLGDKELSGFLHSPRGQAAIYNFKQKPKTAAA